VKLGNNKNCYEVCVLAVVVGVGLLRLERRLTSQRLHYAVTVMALSDNGLVSDPHATVDITVYDASINISTSGLNRPQFSQRLYQMSISEDTLTGAAVGNVSVTLGKF